MTTSVFGVQADTADPAQAWAPRAPDFAAWVDAGALQWLNQLPHRAWLLALQTLSYVQLPQLFALILVAWLVTYALKTRHKAELANQRARWQQVLDSQQQFTVAESFTLGWFNVLLRHLWPTVLEKEMSDKATVVLKVSMLSLERHLSCATHQLTAMTAGDHQQNFEVEW
jgi:hypothetical protein